MARFVDEPFAGSGVLENNQDDLGNQWHVHTSVGNNGLGIVGGNHVEVYTPNAPEAYYIEAVPASADYSVEMQLLFTSSNRLNNTFGPVLRSDVASGDLYLVTWSDAASNLILYRRVGGVFTSLGSSGAVPSADGMHVLKAQIVGNVFTAWWDGVEVVSAVDSDITAAGRVGIRWNHAGSYLGIHIYNMVADDIEGGTPPVRRNPLFFGQDF